jgi:hypothetical protein
MSKRILMRFRLDQWVTVGEGDTIDDDDSIDYNTVDDAKDAVAADVESYVFKQGVKRDDIEIIETSD